MGRNQSKGDFKEHQTEGGTGKLGSIEKRSIWRSWITGEKKKTRNDDAAEKSLYRTAQEGMRGLFGAGIRTDGRRMETVVFWGRKDRKRKGKDIEKQEKESAAGHRRE